MDLKTIETYNNDAKNITSLHSTLIPERIYELASQYFTPNATTIDVGCGTGRDTKWLNDNGYDAIGVDGSLEMLNFAKLNYPEILFVHDYLPEMPNIVGEKFKNILCSAVLMHLTSENLKLACDKLDELLDHDGCIVISFRGTNSDDLRENGKLYSPIDAQYLIGIFDEKNYNLLINESITDEKRGLNWTNIVIKKLLIPAELAAI
jgi:SAM-dependent methyltransferase